MSSSGPSSSGSTWSPRAAPDLAAAAIDTVIDTRLIADPLLAEPSGGRTRSTSRTRPSCSRPARRRARAVRKFVFKSSATTTARTADDPEFFTEAMRPPPDARTAIERDVVAAEPAVAEFAAAARRSPSLCCACRRARQRGRAPRSWRCSASRGPGHPRLRPALPVHPRGGCGRRARPRRRPRLPGTYNAAADGVLALSEVASLLGKPLLPVLPPWGIDLAAVQLRRFGLRVPVELLRALRYGRGLDNRRLKASGFTLPLHDPRGGAEAPRPPAAAPAARQRPGRLPLRARGGGVPAPEPECAPRRRAAGGAR